MVRVMPPTCSEVPARPVVQRSGLDAGRAEVSLGLFKVAVGAALGVMSEALRVVADSRSRVLAMRRQTCQLVRRNPWSPARRRLGRLSSGDQNRGPGQAS
jgi:hypothetical protein